MTTPTTEPAAPAVGLPRPVADVAAAIRKHRLLAHAAEQLAAEARICNPAVAARHFDTVYMHHDAIRVLTVDAAVAGTINNLRDLAAALVLAEVEIEHLVDGPPGDVFRALTARAMRYLEALAGLNPPGLIGAESSRYKTMASAPVRAWHDSAAAEAEEGRP